MVRLLPPQKFVDALRESQLVSKDSLRAMVARLRGSNASSQRIVDELVAESLLTPYQAAELAAGRGRALTLRHYVILDRLGSGAMGDVYLARNSTDGRKYAVKVLSPELRGDATARARLEREAITAHGLDHPNIVRVVEFSTDRRLGPPYLAMEYVDGVSLQAAVALSGTFDAELAADCGRQVAIGLSHAWKQQFVHRDIKPANLLLARSGLLKILDLGIVRSRNEVALTVAGEQGKQILGTIDYLAPEQAIDSSQVDGRADIYALGATLYFLLAGHAPFQMGSQALRLIKKQRDEPPPIAALRPDVPAGLSNAISRMLARRPQDRYQRHEEVAADLAPFAGLKSSSIPAFFENIERAKLGGLTPTSRETTPEFAEPATENRPVDLFFPTPVQPPRTQREPAPTPVAALPIIVALPSPSSGTPEPMQALKFETIMLRPVPKAQRGWMIWTLCAVTAAIVAAALAASIAFAMPKSGRASHDCPGLRDAP